MAKYIVADDNMMTQMFGGIFHNGITERDNGFIQREQEKFLQQSNPKTANYFRGLFQKEAEMFQHRAMQMAKGAVRKLRTFWETDEIRPLDTVEQFQDAPPIMRRFLMANPFMFNKWRDQLCDGYNDVMEDHRETESVEEIIEYRKVNDGVMKEIKDEDSEYAWECECYFDDPELDDAATALSVEDQFDILDCWDRLLDHMLDGLNDPTSEFNATL